MPRRGKTSTNFSLAKIRSASRIGVRPKFNLAINVASEMSEPGSNSSVMIFERITAYASSAREVLSGPRVRISWEAALLMDRIVYQLYTNE